MTMKKTILTLAASLCIGAAAVFAQDTTRTEPQRDQQTQQDKYRTEGMVEVQVADLPEAVSQTLKDAKYSGWEEGKIYLDPESGEYLISIEKDGQAAQQYRFDRNGTDVTDNAGKDQNQQQTDPMNQETDSTRQDDQYRNDQQQNDQENQNDDAAVQSDSTSNQDDQADVEADTTQKVSEQGQVEAETDTAAQDQAVQEEDAAQRDDAAVEGQNEKSDVNYKAEGKNEVGHMEGHYRVIDTAELPEAVVKTLDDMKYNGWKGNAVYLDTKTGDYIVQADPDENTPGQEGKFYRIGKDGKDISKHRKDKD
jgi:hypothetical protein